MSASRINKFIKIILVVGLLLFAVHSAFAAFQEPAGGPTGNNTAAPIHAGGDDQVKEGRLRIAGNTVPQYDFFVDGSVGFASGLWASSIIAESDIDINNANLRINGTLDVKGSSVVQNDALMHNFSTPQRVCADSAGNLKLCNPQQNTWKTSQWSCQPSQGINRDVDCIDADGNTVDDTRCAQNKPAETDDFTQGMFATRCNSDIDCVGSEPGGYQGVCNGFPGPKNLVEFAGPCEPSFPPGNPLHATFQNICSNFTGQVDCETARAQSQNLPINTQICTWNKANTVPAQYPGDLSNTPGPNFQGICGCSEYAPRCEERSLVGCSDNGQPASTSNQCDRNCNNNHNNEAACNSIQAVLASSVVVNTNVNPDDVANIFFPEQSQCVYGTSTRETNGCHPLFTNCSATENGSVSSCANFCSQGNNGRTACEAITASPGGTDPIRPVCWYRGTNA